MKGFALVTLVTAACGGSAPPPAAPPPVAAAPAAAPAAPPAAARAGTPVHDITAEATCARFATLAQQGCGAFDKLVPPDGSCPDLMKPILQDPQGHAVAQCAVENSNCDEVMTCIHAETAAAVKAQPLRACHAKGASPVGIAAREWARRNGSATSQLARTASSRDTPVETCGFDAETAWIDAATCVDGSTPARGKAEAVRVGNVGAGGRCGSIIDQYRVTCPERAYDVYIDAYICAAN